MAGKAGVTMAKSKPNAATVAATSKRGVYLLENKAWMDRPEPRECFPERTHWGVAAFGADCQDIGLAEPRESFPERTHSGVVAVGADSQDISLAERNVKIHQYACAQAA
jgi:hypothetical protein